MITPFPLPDISYYYTVYAINRQVVTCSIHKVLAQDVAVAWVSYPAINFLAFMTLATASA